MQQIADWLGKLGRPSTRSALPRMISIHHLAFELPDQDLKELGVASLGHRRQILRAIAELTGGETARPQPATGTCSRNSARHRRASSGHSDVLGLGGLNGAVGPHGP